MSSKLSQSVKEFMASNGRKGGSRKSPGKKAAILRNLAKARAKRWPSRAKPKEG